jgi:glycosyltransferase involved in cell wall biosynthesis
MFPHGANRFRGWAVFQRTVALARRCPVKVVSPQSRRGLADHEELAGIAVHRPRWRRLPKVGVLTDGRRFAAAARPVVERLRESFDFDVIDTHWAYPDGYGAVRLARQLEVPCVLSVRGSDVNELCFRWPTRRPVRQALRGAAHVVAVSQALKETLASAGIAAERVTVIPNGVDASVFRPSDREAARTALGVSPDETVLFSAGTLVREKGIEHLIAGLSRLGDRPDLRLYVAGAGPHHASLEATADREGLTDRVTFLGHLDLEEMVRWYQAADLFVFASLREGCPNAVIEALACGLPVVSTDVGGVPDLVEPGRDGLLIAAGSAEAFAQALDDAVSRTWDRPAIAERGRQRSWDRVAEEYCEVFEQAVRDWRASE